MKITITSQTTYKGIALKNPTYIYKEPSTSKGTWKSYAQGSILKYQSYSDDWYQEPSMSMASVKQGTSTNPMLIMLLMIQTRRSYRYSFKYPIMVYQRDQQI